MDRKTLVLITILFGTIVLGMFAFAVMYGENASVEPLRQPARNITSEPVAEPVGQPTDEPATQPVPTPEPNSPRTDVLPPQQPEPAAVSLTSEYVDGTYTYSGTLTLPNPCYEVSPEVLIMESYPEQVAIELTVTPPQQDLMCIQVMHEHEFIATAQVSELATVSVRVNGVTAELIE